MENIRLGHATLDRHRFFLKRDAARTDLATSQNIHGWLGLSCGRKAAEKTFPLDNICLAHHPFPQQQRSQEADFEQNNGKNF